LAWGFRGREEMKASSRVEIEGIDVARKVVRFFVELDVESMRLYTQALDFISARVGREVSFSSGGQALSYSEDLAVDRS
jgi:hypothetical protein